MITEKNNVFYCDCGFSFQRGRSGAHDCADGLRNKLAESEARCAALAAENAGLKAAAVFATAPDMWEELGGNVMRYQYQEWYADRLKSAMETPATDAIIAEVRAQGVEMFAAWNDKHIKKGVEHKESLTAVSHAARGLAEQIRKGVQS